MEEDNVIALRQPGDISDPLTEALRSGARALLAQAVDAPAGVEVRAFVPNLDRHLAACDLALVQGGLTTCMELTAAATPFLYFPLKNHFEQNFHVAHRLDRYRAGRCMEFASSTPDMIADAMVDTLNAPTRFAPVEANGAARAACMLAELL